MDIVIIGVGGQGALVASKVIGAAAVAKGFDVKVSEVHGMSKRGGSVETFVRYAEKPIASPIIDKGCADIVIGFEELEALRGVSFLKRGGVMLMNRQRIEPMPVITGELEYPADIEARLKELDIRVLALDADDTAKQIGSPRAANMVMIGALSNLPEILKDFTTEDWKTAIRSSFPEAYHVSNEKAFEAGRNVLKNND